jgi:general secretion pathway protein L
LYRNVVGLDIGSYSLKAVVARGGFGRLEVQRFIEHPLDDPDGPEASSRIAEAISRFMADHSFSGMEVICSFPGLMASTRRLNFPFTDTKKIRSTVPFEVETQVPYEIEDLVLDYQLIEKGPGGAEVLVGLAQREALSGFLQMLEGAGVDPRILELDTTALANISPFLEGPGGFSFLIDVGHAKTCLCGLREGKLHSVRTIPIGGRALTQALMDDLGAPRGEAERRKHEEGLALARSGAASCARTLDRLVKEIDRTLTAPENTGSVRPDRIVLFGGSARMPGLVEHLQEALGVPTSPLTLKPDERFTWRPGPKALAVLPQALGLAVRGTVGASISRLNLRRDEFAYRRDLDPFLRKFMPTAVVVAVLILLGVANVVINTMKNRSIAAQLDHRIEGVFRETRPDVKRIVDPLAQMRFSLDEMRRRSTALGLYGGNVTALDILREISTREPANLDVTLNLLSIDEERIRLHGSTRSFELVDRLESELEKVPFFSQVNIGDVKAERDGGKSFNVTIIMGRPGGMPGRAQPAGGVAVEGKT